VTAPEKYAVKGAYPLVRLTLAATDMGSVMETTMWLSTLVAPTASLTVMATV
jgi:hypothetical protein